MLNQNSMETEHVMEVLKMLRPIVTTLDYNHGDIKVYGFLSYVIQGIGDLEDFVGGNLSIVKNFNEFKSLAYKAFEFPCTSKIAKVKIGAHISCL